MAYPSRGTGKTKLERSVEWEEMATYDIGADRSIYVSAEKEEIY